MEPEREQPEEGRIAREGMLTAIRTQRDRLSFLQRHVDEEGERWMSGIAMTSASEVSAAVTTYDREWFRSRPFSAGLKARMARALIAACADYPFADTSAWERIAGGRP